MNHNTLILSKSLPGFVFNPDLVMAVRFNVELPDSWYIRIVMGENEMYFEREDVVHNKDFEGNEEELRQELSNVVIEFLRELAEYRLVTKS